jgi:hypothetical protein
MSWMKEVRGQKKINSIKWELGEDRCNVDGESFPVMLAVCPFCGKQNSVSFEGIDSIACKHYSTVDGEFLLFGEEE